MVTYYVGTPEMGVSILSDGVGKPFSVRPAADDDLLNSYGFSWPALKLVYDYFSHEKKRIRINNSYSEWLPIIFGVPKGSMLRPHLFNIFLADLFFILSNTDTANFSDDNVPYNPAKDLHDVIGYLEQASVSLFK